MNSIQLTKYAAAVVIALLALIGIGKFSGVLYAPTTPEKPGFEVAVAEEGGAKEVVVEEKVDLSALMAAADIEKGKKVAKKCASCHTFDEGGKNGAGPNLYNVLGTQIAANGAFKYSAALNALKDDGRNWGYEELNEFIKKPKAFAKGTAMGFGGIKKDNQRADLIAYLRSLSADPKPLP